VIEAIDGSLIVLTRKRMGLSAVAFALVLGVSRATLYKWEAEGYFRGHDSFAATLLAWLVSIPGVEQVAIAKEVKESTPDDARVWLVSRYLARTMRLPRKRTG